MTRRALLGAGAGAALAAATGCGDREPARPALGDVGVVAGLDAVERELTAAWTGAAELPGKAGATARDILARERAHAGLLRATFTGPVPAIGGVAPRPVRDASARMRRHAAAGRGRATLRAAIVLEGMAADAYVAALPMLRDPGRRALAAGLCAAQAQHVTVARLALGHEPLPDAFAGLEAT